LDSYPDIYVIGDQAHTLGPTSQPLPGLSPVAIQQGRYVARRIRGKESGPFRYFDKGIMATVGRRVAVLQVGRLRMSGFVAWLGWIFVHIYYLIGFRNRLFVFLQWSWHYLRFGRGARLIVNKEWRSHGNA
jgi:NADH dehydrogenase